MGGGAKTVSSPGILYTNDGSGKPAGDARHSKRPAVGHQLLRRILLLPDAGSGARGCRSGGQGVTTAFEAGQPLDAYTAFEDISKVTPDFKRTLTISGGFLNDLASTSDPKSFVYAFEGSAFPNVPLLQPRLGSVEEWTFINKNNDEHPIHVHVNDFQVTSYYDPTTGLKTGPDMWGVDNANVPAPTHGRRGSRDPDRRSVDADAGSRITPACSCSIAIASTTRTTG